MIITRTPYRVSFVGGGSDLPAYFHSAPGSVVSVTIDKYIYVTVHPYFDKHHTQVKYSKTELVDQPEAIEHPVVREALKKYGITGGIEITSIGDIPSGTGLGSSSSFTVGLLKALSIYQGKYKTKHELAEEACEIEMNILHEPVGKQDQFAAAYGGLNQFVFRADEVEAVPVFMPPDKLMQLERSLMLFYTGVTRDAREVLSQQKQNTENEREKRDSLRKMVDLSYQLRESLERGEIDIVGSLLDQNWQMKKNLATTISNSTFDNIYSIALHNGASGGKLLGAGGGGFFLFFCPPDKQAQLRASLPLRQIPIRFDFQGAKEIYVYKK